MYAPQIDKYLLGVNTKNFRKYLYRSAAFDLKSYTALKILLNRVQDALGPFLLRLRLGTGR